MLHVVCEFNETAEPTRPSYALPATLKSEEPRHGKTPFQTRTPLDQRLESHAKRLRNDRVCPVRDTCVTKRVDPETQNERVRVGVRNGHQACGRKRNTEPYRDSLPVAIARRPTTRFIFRPIGKRQSSNLR